MMRKAGGWYGVRMGQLRRLAENCDGGTDAGELHYDADRFGGRRKPALEHDPIGEAEDCFGNNELGCERQR